MADPLKINMEMEIDLDMSCHEGSCPSKGSLLRTKVKATSKKNYDNLIPSTFEGSKRKRSIILGELEDELERQLEEKAKRNELSGDNVQSLLQAVLTHEDVYKYVESTMAKSDELPEYQLTLTRAKAKELIDRIPKIAPLLCLPMPQKKSDIDVLIREELPEDSSDEEYQPLDETVDDDDDSMLAGGDVSVASSACHTPIPEFSATESDENIGQRTRSKFSLSQTPLETIEQAFIPPDITEDMYDTECDNQDWLNFLKELVQPLDTSFGQEAHDDDDPEYNIQPDELKAVDTEELRADRAVEISKKEINDLIDELLDYTNNTHEDGVPSDEEKKDCKANEVLNHLPNESQLPISYVHNFSPETHLEPSKLQNTAEYSSTTTQEISRRVAQQTSQSPNPGTPATSHSPTQQCEETDSVVSEEQRLLLKQQLAQHVQLLLQTCLLSCGSPFVSNEIREAAKSHLLELKTRQDSANVVDSVFLLPTLDKSVELLSRYETYVNTNLEAMLKWNREKASHNKYIKTVWAGCAPIHPVLMKLCLQSKAFQYPLLLPRNGFRDATKGRASDLFSPAQDLLITSGLHDCVFNLEMKVDGADLLECCELIHNSLVPDKTPKRIFDHIKRKCKCGPETNPIKRFFKIKYSPGVEHFVVPVDNTKLLPLYLKDPLVIDISWHKALYAERDYQKSLLMRKKQKLLTSAVYRPIVKSEASRKKDRNQLS